MFSGIFSPDHKVAGRARKSLIIYNETLHYAVIYLLQTKENNLAVHKMTVNKKRLYYFIVDLLV